MIMKKASQEMKSIQCKREAEEVKQGVEARTSKMNQDREEDEIWQNNKQLKK